MASSSVKVDLNRATIAAYTRGQHGVGAAVRAQAEPILATARAIAPVETGAYRNSLTATEEVLGGQLEVRIGATVPYAIYVEADSGTMARSLGA